MCRLFFIYSKDEDFLRRLAIALWIKSVELRNDDGYFYATPTESVRTLSEDQFLESLKTVNTTRIIVHARMASTGVVSKRNIHGWKGRFNGELWYFAHNGIVGKYSDTRRYTSTYPENYFYSIDVTAKKTDSERFFRNLLKTEVDRWSELVDETVFSGVAFMINQDLTKMYIIATSEPYIAEYREDNSIAYVISSQRDILVNIPTSYKIQKRGKIWFLPTYIEKKVELFNKLQKEVLPLDLVGIHLLNFERGEVIEYG